MRISDWSSDVCSSDLCGAIGEIDRAPLVVVKEARDPVDRARGARDEARLLNEQVVIAIGVQCEGNGLREGSRKVDIEGRVIVRQRRRADELGEVELVIDRHIVIGELALEQVGAIRDRKSTRLNSSHYCASRLP